MHLPTVLRSCRVHIFFPPFFRQHFTRDHYVLIIVTVLRLRSPRRSRALSYDSVRSLSKCLLSVYTSASMTHCRRLRGGVRIRDQGNSELLISRGYCSILMAWSGIIDPHGRESSVKRIQNAVDLNLLRS